jgi:hypothetical protein
MPLFGDDTQESFKANGSGFHFSGVNINQLGASEYTLVGIACDTSSSVMDFAQEIEACLRSTIESCQRSPRVDNLLLRLLTFASQISEQHGFRPFADCHEGKYKGVIQCGGQTSLYDASVNLVDSLATYGKQLIDNDFTANGIVVVITDGMDVGSTLNAKHVKDALARAMSSEALESVVSILIGVNVTNPQVSQFLQEFKNQAGFTQYVEAQDASAKTLARLAAFISKSVSSQSQSVGTGGPSQPITF